MASSELLKQIQAGKRLRKSETNDRSAPVIDSKPAGAGAGPRAPASAPVVSLGGGPPQLGGLFAGGVPKLKPAGQGNLAKAPTLGKPPAVPTRASASPAASAPSPPSRAAPPKPSSPAPSPAHPPTPPVRGGPSLPSRAPPVPARAPPPPARATPSPPAAVPAPPRRPPPPPRTASPPAPSRAPPVRPPRSVSVHNASPANTPSLPARAAPLPPRRPTNVSLVPPARKAPSPPARPSSIASSSPSRPAPPPPVRKAPITDGAPAHSVHVRALSETESSPVPPPPGPPPARTSLAPPPQRARIVFTPTPSDVPSRPHMSLPNRQANGTRPSAPIRKIPSPPPEAGPHRFPTSDFPPPRTFTPGVRQYGGGRQRGSDFDLSNI